MELVPRPGDCESRQEAARTSVRHLVAEIRPVDETEAQHRSEALSWLDATSDIYRRVPPDTPDRHLVAYVALMEEPDGAQFLVGHRRAGLWLPPGGHVEPGEYPAAAARREAHEELGVPHDFHGHVAEPCFVTVTQTLGEGRHVDVSLWFPCVEARSLELVVDHGEFTGGRWWTQDEIASADPGLFDPHYIRFLRKVGSGDR